MRFLATAFFTLLSLPVSAQGSGPADFGLLNYPILAIWLFFWLTFIVYPVALLVYAFKRMSNSAKEDGQDMPPAPSLAGVIFGRALIVHVVLAVVGTIIMAW